MDDDRRTLERARHLVDLGRYPEGLEVLAGLRAARPDDPEAHALTAVCHLALDELGEALAAANAQVRTDPDHEWGHRIASLVLDRMGRHDEAVAAATTAVRLDPHTWRTHQALASAAVDARGQGRLARQAADRAVELGPHEPSTHYILGLVAQRFRDDETARAAYRRTLALDPQHATAINNLAVLDGGFSIAEQARRFGSALRHEPGSEAVRGNIDGLAVRFVRRLYFASLLAFVVGLVASLRDVGTTDVHGEVTTASVVVGVALLLGVGAYTVGLARRIPVGIRHYVRARMVRDRFLVANVALTAVMLVAALAVCFLPGGASFGLVALRPIGLANVVLFAWTFSRRG